MSNVDPSSAPILWYQQLLASYTGQSQQLQAKLRLFSAFRLALFVLALILGYYYFQTDQTILLWLALLSLASFFVLIRLYDQRKRALEITRALARINQTEIDVLEGKPSPYESGKELIDPQHPYSYDLDLFGDGSLFQHLNRTTTSFGKSKLSADLLSPDTTQIEQRQQSVRELATLLNFRQQLQAAGIVHSAEEKKINKLRHWLNTKPAFSNPVAYYALLIFPLATLVFLILFLVTDDPVYKSLLGISFVVNLAITFSFGRKMLSYIGVSGDINKTLVQFSDQLVILEKQEFRAPVLSQLQAKLKYHSRPASQSIAALASRFNYLDYLYNIFLSPLLNGFLLFHLHVLYALDQWKKTHGKHVMDWLEVIGEIESLNCFAGLHYNNSSFCFPEVAKEEDLSATAMGHPLIRASKRVSNDISFRERKFVVLTGSNMSGKSTFLRTLGVNLVLARAGASVCASSFRFYPYDVYVSMRINDSLQDSESLFYAELKRLQHIIEHISAGNKTFIILDEILRGTNSNDKHNGTVGLIRQMLAKNACGIIATHDLSVADLAKEHPHYISARCFESEIINDELLFDYKIKNGVCTKLSASFLMKKLGIIQ